jgi:hypothetical protein
MDSAEAEIDAIIDNSIRQDQTEEEMPLDQPMQQENSDAAMQSTVANNQVEEDSSSIEVFNTALHQYLRINEEIKSLMLAIKERNDIKRKLGDTLSNYLKSKQIKEVNLDGSYKGKKLEVEVKTSTTGFSRASVTEAILNEFESERELFDKVMSAISKTSVLKEVWKLKVIEEKTAKTTKGTRGGKGKGKTNEGLSLAEAAALVDD